MSDQPWFTEKSDESGIGFSLKVSTKLHEEQTPYQKLEIFETATFGRLMTLDGLVMLTDRDNFIYHEMMTHPALFTHPSPKRVAIIGGGDCGSLREVLKHPGIESCEQIELDERVTRISEKFFPALCESNNDPRAKFQFDDGIEWIRNSAPGAYDVIIIDSTDPIGPAAGLFSQSFYQDCFRALGDKGVVIGQSESPLLHKKLIRSMHDNFRAAGFGSVTTFNFPQCSYPSGWWSSTMAAKGTGDEFRYDDALSANLGAQYYSADMHRAAAISPPFLMEALSI
ncbi:MAG: polyamine aminopropyltransferase [Acidiferrobacterales bacterium]|nr:polyamine aminopropyltransferase [Acidiferrobacterales bacterium]